MGRTFPVMIARVASIFLAAMLLFMTVHHARAENTDGYGLKTPGMPEAGDYGLKPMPADAGPSNAGFTPAAAGFVPAPQQSAPPAYQAAPQPMAYQSPPQQPQQQPTYQPPPQQPAYQPPPAAAPIQRAAQSGPFGYRSGDGLEDGQAAMPAYGAAPVQQAARQPSGPAPGMPGYVLGPGDKIKLTVFGETDLSGDFTIDGSGQLALPLIGQLRAAGYSAAQLEQTVAATFARGYLKSPRISIEVSTYRPFYIIGAVNRPGEYPYVNHMNALNAVALAGGYQNQAVESVVFIRREGSNREVQLPTDRTTMIYPGDVVRVHFTFLSDAMSIFSPLTSVAGAGAVAATIH